MTAPIDNRDFLKVISEIGADGTLTTATVTIDTDWGSPNSVSTSVETIAFVFKVASSNHPLVKQGRIKEGDAVGYFKTTDTIADGQKIEVNSVPYRIKMLRNSSIVESIFQKALLVKIQ